MRLTRNALVHFSFLGLRFILNCGLLSRWENSSRWANIHSCGILLSGMLAGLNFVMLHARRRIKKTVHLQNLNCLASLRTKVIPASVNFETV